MYWKKTRFSYLMWTVYTLFAGWALTGLTVALSGSMGLGNAIGYGMAAGVCLLAAICVFLLNRVYAKPKASSEGISAMAVTEAVAVVVLLFLGLLLRMDGMGKLGLSEGVPGGVYFEKAQVLEGQTLARTAGSAAEYLYLRLLHLLFVFVGNSETAGLWLQILLQLPAGLFLYLGVRRFGGALAGLIFLSFFMCGESGVEEALTLSPNGLYLLLFAAGLLLCGCKGVRALKPGWFLAAGFWAGVLLYLDLTGGLLLVFLGAAALWGETSAKKKRLLAAGAGLLGTALSFVLSAAADGLMEGRMFSDVLDVWTKLYQPRIFTHTGGYYFSVMEGSLLTTLFVFGVFSFWCSKKWERMSVWVAACCVGWTAYSLGMLQQALSPAMLLLLLFAALAGLGVEGACRGELAQETAGEEVSGAEISGQRKGDLEKRKRTLGKEKTAKSRAKNHGGAADKTISEERRETRLPKYLQGSANIAFLKEEAEEESGPEPELVPEADEAAFTPVSEPESVREAKPQETETIREPETGEEFVSEQEAEHVPESEWEEAAVSEQAEPGIDSPEAEPAPVSEPEAKPQETETVREPETGEEFVSEQETESAPEPEAVAEEEPKGESEGPRYIENPLPLPKPHQKKVLDYDYPVEPDKADYDLAVDENDDFDLK